MRSPTRPAPRSNPQFESPHQFLEHEDSAGDRRVEGGGETGDGAGREQHPAIGPIATKGFAHEMAQGRGHMHARPLAAKRKSGADRKRPADELHRNDAKPRLRQLPIEDGFDMRDAASDRLGEMRRTSEAAAPAAAAQPRTTSHRPSVPCTCARTISASRNRSASSSTRIEGDPGAGNRADDKRQRGQEREAPTSSSGSPAPLNSGIIRGPFRPSDGESQSWVETASSRCCGLARCLVAAALRLSVTRWLTSGLTRSRGPGGRSGPESGGGMGSSGSRDRKACV